MAIGRRFIVYALGASAYGAASAAYYHAPIVQFLRPSARLADRFRDYAELVPQARAAVRDGRVGAAARARLDSLGAGADAPRRFDRFVQADIEADRIVHLAGWPFSEIEVAYLAGLGAG